MLVAARTHDYGKQPVDHLAKLLRSESIEAAQLVLPKAFSEINSYDEVTPRWWNRFEETLRKKTLKFRFWDAIWILQIRMMTCGKMQ
mgnify:CR=1 FL=1